MCLWGGGKKFKIIVNFFLYLILINLCTFSISYVRGVKELRFEQMTVSYRLKYVGLGFVFGTVFFAGEILYKHREHQLDIHFSDRSGNFEVLRIIAMGMIVLFHYAYGKWDYSGMGKYKVVIDIIWMFGELGVNVFALISGYFMADQERPFKRRKICLMWIQVLFYSMLATIVESKMGILEIDQTSILQTIFPITYKGWWYMSAYFVLYFLAPFLNKGLKALERKEYCRLIWCLLTIFSIWPTIIGIFDNNTEVFLFYNRFIWIIVIYCVGGYIKKYGVYKEKWTLHHWVYIHVAMWVITLLSIIGMPENGISEKIKIRNTYFWQPNSIVMVALAVSLFMIFSCIRVKRNRIISYIASCTLGIYLGHGGRFALIRNTVFHRGLVGAKAVFVDMICAFTCMVMVTLGVESFRKQLEKMILKVVNKARLYVNV